MPSFAARLSQRIQDHSPLCVGLDPSASLLAVCGLPDSAAGALEFGQRVLSAAHFELALIKPQVAFFERFGSAGIAALEELAALARAREVLVLLDGKRGDIDTTGTAYAAAYFAPGAPLRVDAVTTHPYLGLGALHGLIDFAVANQGGVFVVVRSSNPEGFELQTARLASGLTVAQDLCRQIGALNQRYAAGAMGPVGAVIGATCEDAAASVADSLMYARAWAQRRHVCCPVFHAPFSPTVPVRRRFEPRCVHCRRRRASCCDFIPGSF
jgi:orotidine-5'-phosphate decarboxylase